MKIADKTLTEIISQLECVYDQTCQCSESCIGNLGSPDGNRPSKYPAYVEFTEIGYMVCVNKDSQGWVGTDTLPLSYFTGGWVGGK